jgi:hypothetical protein
VETTERAKERCTEGRIEITSGEGRRRDGSCDTVNWCGKAGSSDAISEKEERNGNDRVKNVWRDG